MMNIDNSNTSILLFVKQHLKLLIIVSVVAIACSVIFSSPFFIAPKYKSEAALYPSNLINYSSESSTEQLLQLLEGNDVRDTIISKYNLIEHYDIDSASSGYLFKLFKEFNSNIKIGKTTYESVNIQVLDTDPELAKLIAEEFIGQVNLKIRKLHQEKASEVVLIYKDQLSDKKMLIDTLEAQIKRYSIQYGLLDYTQQSREVTAGYMNMLLANKKGESMKKAEELYQNVKEEGRHFHDLHHQLNLARDDYNKILINYDNAVRDSKKRLTYTNTIVYPEVSDKKVYPVRWLIVLISLIGTLFFTFMVILFYNRLKQL
jgi:capsule polysaccharide export protein KpsE/RkpR